MTSKQTQDAVLESTALAALLLLGNAVFASARPGFSGLALHPGVLAVAFVAFRHGTRGGAIAVAAVGGFHWLSLFFLGDVSGPFELVTGHNASVLTSLGVAGALCGWLAQSHIDAVFEARARASELEAKADARTDELESLRNTNAELAARVVDAQHTIPILARISRRLHGGREELAQTLGPLLRETIGARGGSVWNSSPPHCLQSWGTGGPNRAPNGTCSDDFRQLVAGLAGGQTIGLEQVAPSERTEATPFLLGCIGPAEAPIFVAIDDMDLDDYNRASRELFDVVIGWAHDLAIAESRRPATTAVAPTVAPARSKAARTSSTTAPKVSSAATPRDSQAVPPRANAAAGSSRSFGARLAKLPGPGSLPAPARQPASNTKPPPPPLARRPQAPALARRPARPSVSSTAAARVTNKAPRPAGSRDSSPDLARGTGPLRRVLATAADTLEGSSPPSVPLSAPRPSAKAPLNKVFREVSHQLAPGSAPHDQSGRN